MIDRSAATGWTNANRASQETRPATGLERLLVVLALPSVLPLMLGIAIWIRVTSAGPVILRLTRTDAQGGSWQEYRFRCVWEDARARGFRNAAAGEGAARDPRVTPAGAFLLRTGLNRLPGLFNVLAGHCALFDHFRD